MRKLTREKRTLILAALTEGTGVRATARICGVSKLTVMRLLSDVGVLCRDYHDLMVRNLKTKRAQVDEIWSFVGCKQKQKDAGGQGEGDCWTWIGLDSDSKLVISYRVGLRTAGYAQAFMQDIASRIDTRTQLTSDGLNLYLAAVQQAFNGMVDYAQLIKIYGRDVENDTRYSPAQCIGCERHAISGRPDPEHVSTSFVERQNLRLRMENRRHTRLTLGYSKKWANHEHAIALHYFAYNFIRRHTTLKTTPAIAAGITDKAWTVADLVELLESEERKLTNGGRINRADRT